MILSCVFPVPKAVFSFAFRGPVLERHGQGTCLLVVGSFLHVGDKEALLALHVVLLGVGGGKLEVDGHAARLVAVVVEVLAGLDVVLVGVRPVEVDLLAVVRDGVLLPSGVATLGEEVAVVVVAGEEGVDVVEDLGLQVFEVYGVARAGAELCVLLAERRLPKSLAQLPLRVYGVPAEGLLYALRRLPQLLGPRGLAGSRATT